MADYLAAVRSAQIRAMAHNPMCAKIAQTAAKGTGPASKYRTIMESPALCSSRVVSVMICRSRSAFCAPNRTIVARSVVRPAEPYYRCGLGYRRALAVKTAGRLAAAV